MITHMGPETHTGPARNLDFVTVYFYDLLNVVCKFSAEDSKSCSYMPICPVSNDRLKDEVLCKSFSSVFTSESAFNSIDFNINNNNISNMEGLKLDPSDILTRLTKLNVNKSAGPDDIYPRILYEAREQLVYPLKT